MWQLSLLCLLCWLRLGLVSLMTLLCLGPPLILFQRFGVGISTSSSVFEDSLFEWRLCLVFPRLDSSVWGLVYFVGCLWLRLGFLKCIFVLGAWSPKLDFSDWGLVSLIRFLFRGLGRLVAFLCLWGVVSLLGFPTYGALSPYLHLRVIRLVSIVGLCLPSLS